MKMLTKQEILERLEENEGRIKGYGVNRIGLFGSYVKNEQKGKAMQIYYWWNLKRRR